MRDQDLFLERALHSEQRVATDQIERAKRYALENDVDLTDALINCEILPGRDVALIKAEMCEVPYVNLADYEPSLTNTTLVPRSLAERFLAFPLFVTDGVLTLAMDDPLNLDATDQIRQITKCDVDTVLADREQIRAVTARAYALNVGAKKDEEIKIELDEAAPSVDISQPVVAAVNQLLTDALVQRASDIHLNPDEHELRLRFRVDGVLQERQGPSLSMHASLVQRLKVMAQLDLTQTRRPQDGKFRFRHGNVVVDVRMSTVPTICGENVVLRLLANQQSVQSFHELGMPAAIIRDVEQLISHPYGMMLVTGPTGSGKTTTLYAALNRLNTPAANVMTIEDPVEIRLPYLRQIQVNPEIGLTFANALRSILRQDPDIVLVGEVRDNETATIAMQAALTGHMVLSTVHTNDAAGAIARLRDYHLPPFVINSALLGVIAQRLVRRVCQHCTTTDRPDDLLAERFGIAISDREGFVRGKGCRRCGQTGYRGRVGIYELLRNTTDVQHLIEQVVSVQRIREHAVSQGMRLMWQDGLEKARVGLTTLSEVAKVASVLMLEGEQDEDQSAGGDRPSAISYQLSAEGREPRAESRPQPSADSRQPTADSQRRIA
jgi:type IV pilus assembly protein PilB